MKLSRSLLNEAKGSVQRPWTFSATQISNMNPDKRPKNLLLKDIPRTALPRDILRCLIDGKAVGPTFPSSALTSGPPSLPRAPSLFKTWHLSLDSAEQASSVYYHLTKRPLFMPAAEHRPYRSFPLPSSNPDLGTAAPIRFTSASSEEWITRMLQDAEEGTDSRYEDPEKNGNKERRDFTPQWVMRSDLSGKRVVIKGLPGRLDYGEAKRLAKGIAMADGEDGCKKLPPSKFNLVSTFCFTVHSVSDAYRLVRKVHMKWYKSSKHGEKYLMRAEVVY